MSTPHRPFWHRWVQAVTAPTVAEMPVLANTLLGLSSAMRPLALEQRFMFDGAGAADAAHTAADGAAVMADGGHDAAAALLVPQAVEVRAANPVGDGGKKEVVLIDTSLANYQTLAAGVRDGVGIVEFDGHADGLAQIAAWAVQQGGYDAIHILTHGSEGVVHLGPVRLDLGALASATVQTGLAQLGQALTADGDLLLYGCDVAAGDGAALLAGLAKATGADVAASTDLTGAARLGGNWTLEAQIGTIEARELALTDYDHLLSIVPTTTVNVSSLTYDTGNSGSDFLTKTATNGFSGTLSAPLTATQKVQVSYDGGTLWSDATTYATNSSSWSVDTTLIEGTHTIQVRVAESYDGGSTYYGGTAKSQTYTLDTVSPILSFNTIHFSTDTGISNTDFITTTASQTINATLSAALDVGERLWASTDNGSTYTDVTSDVTGTTLSWANQTLSGSNTLAFKVTDLAGNDSMPTVQPYVIDTTAPSTTVLTLSFSNDSNIVGDFYTNIALQNISGTLSNNLGSDERVEISLNNGATWMTATTVVGQNTFSLTGVILAASTTLKARLVDAAGNWGTSTSQDYVLDTTAPTGVALSTNTVATNMANVGATIATLSASESSLTYQFATGNGVIDADNARFTISGNALQVGTSSLPAGTYHIYVKATDAAGNAAYQSFTVTVQDPLTVSSIVRAAGASALVPGSATQLQYTVTFSEAVTGVDASDFTLTFAGSASGSIASFTGSGATYTITVSGISGDGTLRLDLNSSGTGIQGTSSNIAVAGGYISGQTFTLDHTAPASPSTPTLTAASDTGASSSDRISNVTTPMLTGTAEVGSTVTLYDTDRTTVLGTGIAGSGYWVITSSALAPGEHSLSVTATDAAGNVSALSTALQITIDTSAPGVNSVAVPADGTYQSGETLTFNVNFNEAVLVDTSGGTPRIALTIGSATRYATYVSGSGSNTLVFSYVVVNGDSDNDGITVGALSTNGGSVRDVAGNDASTTINGMGSTTAVLVDGREARVTNISASSDNGSYGAGSTITITVEFSSAVDVDITGGMPSLSLSSGGTASYVDGSGTSTLTFSYTVGAGQNSADLDYSSANALQLNGASITESSNHRAVAITLAAPDSAGSLGANKNLVIDTVAPTAVGSSVFFSADTGNNGTDLITKTAAQTISGTLSGTLAINESVWVSLDNGSHWTQATVTGSNWTLPDQILNSSNTLQVRVQDAAANYGPAFSAFYVLDVGAPTVSISSNTSTLKAGEAATITFTFSEQSTGFPLGGLTAFGGTLSNFSTTANPLVYTVIFTPSAGFSGNASVTLANNLYTDIAGNYGSGGSSPTLAVDTTIPTLSISSNHSSLKVGETGVITFTFSEVPTGFNITDLVISGGTLSGFTATANPLVYTAVVTPTAGINDGILSVTVAAGTFTDVAGNASQASSSVAISYDTATPTTSAMSVVFSNDTGTSSTDFITNTAAQTISGTLSANLLAGETVYVSTDNGGTWHAATSDGLNGWSVSNMSLTSVGASAALLVKVSDTAGNDGNILSQAYTYDTTAPTAASVTPLTTQSLTPVLSGSATLAVGDSLTISVGGATYNVTPVAGAWTLDLATAVPISGALKLLLNQQYSVVTTTTDVAGNQRVGNGFLTLGTLAGTQPPLGVSMWPDIRGQVVAPSVAAMSSPADMPNQLPVDSSLGHIGGSSFMQGAGYDSISHWPGLFPQGRGGSDLVGRVFALGNEFSSNNGFLEVVLPAFSEGRLAGIPIPDVLVVSGERIAVQMGGDAFMQWEASAAVTLAAASADGSPLPKWLRFDAKTGRFEGTPPLGFEGTLSFKVVARDSQGRVAVQVFRMVISAEGVKTSSLPEEMATHNGRVSLTEQLRSANQGALLRLTVVS